MPYVPSAELVERIAAGDVRAAGRLISRAESSVEEAREALAQVYRRAGQAHVIGITGVPGSGKSTLVAKLITALRAEGLKKDEKIGVIAVDPSSPFSGGAILGDRIRMTEHATDDSVFIRSMATHGMLGGMAPAVLHAVDVLDVAGFRTIIIETVGVGQDEVEIAQASDTTIVVTAPGLGDDVQAIKAGILEIADIHVVSKCDREDATRTLADLTQMLNAGVAMQNPEEKRPWQIPIVGVSSVTRQGIDELAANIHKHRLALQMSELGAQRQQRVARFRLAKTAEHMLTQRFTARSQSFIPRLAHKLAYRLIDPYTAARELILSTIRHEFLEGDLDDMA